MLLHIVVVLKYIRTKYFYFLGRFHIQFYEEGHSDKLKGIMLQFDYIIFLFVV